MAITDTMRIMRTGTQLCHGTLIGLEAFNRVLASYFSMACSKIPEPYASTAVVNTTLPGLTWRKSISAAPIQPLRSASRSAGRKKRVRRPSSGAIMSPQGYRQKGGYSPPTASFHTQSSSSQQPGGGTTERGTSERNQQGVTSKRNNQGRGMRTPRASRRALFI